MGRERKVPARGVGEVGMSDHMRDYMAGRIDAAEYVRRTKRDSAIVVRRELRRRRRTRP